MTLDAFILRFEEPIKRTQTGYLVRCPAHEDKQASLSVTQGNDGKILVKCFAGCAFTEIVSALGLEPKDLFPEKATDWKPARPPQRKPIQKPKPDNDVNDPLAVAAGSDPEPKSEIETIYSYRDALDREVYQAIRLKPKSFRQRRWDGSKWVWNMNGVERVLYRLPVITKVQTVWVVEGEKDADNLSTLGFQATCNVAGAGKWLDGYTESLKGKDVVLCGDNDKAGQDHIRIVFDSIAGKAKTVRIVKVPAPNKDISDYIATFATTELARAAINELLLDTIPFVDGIKLPLYTMAEIEPKYAQQAQRQSAVSLNFSSWLPTLGRRVRPIIPGELVLMVGDTGAGKTALLQNVANSTQDLWTLMFEMELPEELLFERFIASRNEGGADAREIEAEYQNGFELGPIALNRMFPRLLICPESGLTIERMEQLIIKSELKMGAKPQLVLIDYVQLMRGKSTSRYERTSDIAEGLKMLAKSTRTIIVVASQVTRPKNETRTDGKPAERITLHSAKDSGALENSAGVVIGAWRDNEDYTLLHLKVLKATKGGSGTEIQCNFDGARMIITERSPITEEDVPEVTQQPEFDNPPVEEPMPD